MKIEIDMGATAASGAVPGPAMLDLEELLATRLLVQGNSGSGKSHLLRRLLEQSAPHVQQVVIDPEGDFVGLAERFGHVVVDGDRSVAELETIAARVRQHRISAVLTLETLDAEMQMRAAAVFLNALFDADRDHWFPALVIVDEAQLFAPAVSGDVSDEARKLSLGAMTNLMCRGRKRGLAGIIATQRSGQARQERRGRSHQFPDGPHLPRHRHGPRPPTCSASIGARRRCSGSSSAGSSWRSGRRCRGARCQIRVGGVETAPRGGTPRLDAAARRPCREGARDLILAPVPMPARVARQRGGAPRRRAAAETLRCNEVLEEIVRNAARAAVARRGGEPALPPERAGARASEGIARDIMADRRQRRSGPNPCCYGDFQVRCRIAKVGGAVALAGGPAASSMPPAPASMPTVRGRTRMGRDALAVARTIPDDLQAGLSHPRGVRRSTGAPCPSDGEVARRCGHAFRRPRPLAHPPSRQGRPRRDALRHVGETCRRAARPSDGRAAPGDPDAPAVLAGPTSRSPPSRG